MSEATALLRLQEIDLELMRSKKVAQDLPQRAKVEAARAAVKKVMGELTKIIGQRKESTDKKTSLTAALRDFGVSV